MAQPMEVPEWLFNGPASLGIRFAICDEVAKEDPDGHGDLDAMRLEATIPGDKPTYLIGAHFTFESDFGYPYEWWEYRAVQMGDSSVPVVRETTKEEDRLIEEGGDYIDSDEEDEEDEDEEYIPTEPMQSV